MSDPSSSSSSAAASPPSQSAAEPELASGAASIDIDALKAWHREYLAVADSCWTSDAVIEAVKSDKLDYDQIETQVQQLVSSADVSQGFCAKCRHLFDHWPVSSQIYGRDRAVGRRVHTHEIEAAAKAGCKCCAFLLSKFKRTDYFDLFRKIEMRLRSLGEIETASLTLEDDEFRRHPVQRLKLNWPGKFQHAEEPTGLKPFLLCSNSLRGKPTSDRLATARTWLAVCSDSHKDCRNKKSYRPPTRLISIGHDAVSLVTTENLQSPPKYATLSYCWGQQPFIKLTRENIWSFMDRIPQDELPPTFTDAFEVARQLNIHYIWIDALCIIQNDDPNVPNNDWTKEAGYMSSVYGGAYVNFAATTATSPHQGFLQRPGTPAGFVAEVTTDGCRTARNFYIPWAFPYGTRETHLAGRAWTFQERMLPARTMYFGDRGLFWICRSQSYTEFAPDGEFIPDGCEAVDGRGGHKEDQPWAWDFTIDEYTQGQLTFPSDKLPALSGIAARQGDITGKHYLAGMWRESLETQLCWRVERHICSRPEWRAPTWSWASVDGKVSTGRIDSLLTYPGMDQDSFVRVEDARTTLADPSLPYGTVSEGELTLSCSYLFRGTLCTRSGYEDNEDCRRDALIVQGSDIYRVPISLDCLENSPDPEGYIYILPVLHIEPRSEYSREIRGLVLQLSDDTKDRFHRVGSFLVRSGDHRTHATFEKVFEEADISTAAAEGATSSFIEDSEHEERPYKIIIK